LIHGWVLWAAWSILGLVQLVTIRYSRMLSICERKVSYNMKIALHLVNGLAILILTIVMSVEVIKYFDGMLHTYNLHSSMGLAVLFSTCGIVVLGFVVWLA
jgi:hypothetical protein